MSAKHWMRERRKNAEKIGPYTGIFFCKGKLVGVCGMHFVKYKNMIVGYPRVDQFIPVPAFAPAGSAQARMPGVADNCPHFFTAWSIRGTEPAVLVCQRCAVPIDVPETRGFAPMEDQT